MKIPKGFKLPEVYNMNSREFYSTKLNKFLYGLKQFDRMWYNRLSEFLLKEGYKNDPICLFVFIKRFEFEFFILLFMLMI